MKNLIKIIGITLIILFSNNTFAEYNTINSGNWVSDTVWDGVIHPPIVIGNSSDGVMNINENHIVELNNTFIINKNGFILNVWGDLTIYDLDAKNNLVINVYNGGTLRIINQVDVDSDGDLESDNGLVINIETGGLFLIDGDFSVGNNTNLTINGELAIEGDVTIGNNIILEGTGTIYVGGDNGFPTNPNGPIIVVGFLPIELYYFKSIQNDSSVILEWETLTETNNDYFIIEKSTDLQNWEVVSYKQGAGNSNTPLKYELIDNDPVVGISYYRLTQHDYDGKFEVFNPIHVYWNPMGQFKVKIYDLMGNLINEEYIISINEYVVFRTGRPMIIIFYRNDEVVKTIKTL